MFLLDDIAADRALIRAAFVLAKAMVTIGEPHA